MASGISGVTETTTEILDSVQNDDVEVGFQNDDVEVGLQDDYVAVRLGKMMARWAPVMTMSRWWHRSRHEPYTRPCA
jgi:hypothetical protein